MADIERNKQIARNYFAALNAGDVTKLFDLLHDDLEYWVPGDWQMAGRHTKPVFRSMMDEFSAGPPLDEPLQLTAHTFTAEDDRVAVEVTSHARSGDKEYNNTYHILFVIRDGKIIKLHEYLDTLKAVAFFFG
jgi:uncharacterized protein